MSSLSFALNGAGVMAGTYGVVLGLAGIVGVIVTTPTFCPASVGGAGCANAASKAAGLATQGVIVAGAAGLMIAGSRLADPEA